MTDLYSYNYKIFLSEKRQSNEDLHPFNLLPETTELLEENIRKKLLITCLGNDFIDMKQKAPKKRGAESISETTLNLTAIAQQKSQRQPTGKINCKPCIR